MNLAVDSARDKAALDLLEPGQLGSCRYQGAASEGDMQLQARLSTPYVRGLLEALDFM